MDSSQLSQLEQLAENAYTSTDQNTRTSAESALQSVCNDVSFIPQCQFLLDRSTNVYALHLASSSLLKLFSIFHSTFSREQTVEIRNYILNYLASNFVIPSFVIKSLIQLVCRVTKVCWNEDNAHREFVNEVTKFFQHSVRHMTLGMQILTELIVEMNLVSPGQSITLLRKIAVSFRDISLLNIFQLSISTIRQIVVGQISFQNEAEQDALKHSTLSVVLQCLSFDYIGTNPDESSEDTGTIQVPASWRSNFEDLSVIRMFFDMALKEKPVESCLTMQILVQFASVRRSLFSQDERRTQYLIHIITGTVELLEQMGNSISSALTNPDTYAQFCRLLSRLKANYQLSELVKMELYPKWINLVAKFTMDSFKNYEWAENGLYFLLGLWARLTVSIPFMKGDIPNFLIVRQFITVRLESVNALLVDDNADDLFGEVNLEEQSRHLPTLCRLVYSETVAFIKSVYDPLFLSYQQMTQNLSQHSDLSAMTLLEARLSFLVYVIASLISAQSLPGSNPEEQESLDADLMARVFQLIKVIDFRQVNQTNVPLFPYLDLSVIKFLQEFRRLHVGSYDTASSRLGLTNSIMESPDIIDDDGVVDVHGRRPVEQKEPPIYVLLSRSLGPVDQLSMLNLLLLKIVQNLKYYGAMISSTSFLNNSVLIKDSLNLLSDLSAGYNSSKLMLLMNSVKNIITSHGPENFPFILLEENFKSRSTFYVTIGRLVFSESNIDLFDPFMLPFENTIAHLCSQNDLRAVSNRNLFVGLCRDLRGVSWATANKKTYNLLLDWIYPKHIEIFHRMITSCWDVPSVVIPFLRFWNEMVFNKSQRIMFDPISPNGLLLFKESVKFFIEYGEPLLNGCIQNPINGLMTNDSSRDLYKTRYKAMSLSMILVSRLLAGNYVPLGAFALYNDKCLTDAIDLIIKMIVHMRDCYNAYPKVTKTLHTLLEILFRNHVSLLLELDHSVFTFLLTALHDGLTDLETQVSSLAATSLDHLFSFAFKMSRKRDASPICQLIASHFQLNHDLLQSLMSTLFNLNLFDQVSHHWALARPIFSLMLIDESIFVTYKQQLFSTQSAEVQNRLTLSFSELMDGIQPSLDSRIRDRFSQNLMTFRTNASKYLLRPNL